MNMILSFLSSLVALKRKREREHRESTVGIFVVLDGSRDLSCPDFSQMFSFGGFCSPLHADWI